MLSTSDNTRLPAVNTRRLHSASTLGVNTRHHHFSPQGFETSVGFSSCCYLVISNSSQADPLIPQINVDSKLEKRADAARTSAAIPTLNTGERGVGECCLIWSINRNNETPQASKVGKRPLSSSCTTCTLRPRRRPCQYTRQPDSERTCDLCRYSFLAAWEVRMGPAHGTGLGPKMLRRRSCVSALEPKNHSLKP